MTPSSKPLYTAKLDIGGVAWEARVNDAPLYAEPRGLYVGMELPLNRWIRNGSNRFSFHFRPAPGQTAIPPTARFSATIYVREWDEPRESRREVGRVQYPAITVDGRLDRIVAGNFEAQLTYPPFLWFNSELINDDDATRSDLLAQYIRFHGLFDVKDVEGLINAVAARDREDAAAAYVSIEEQVTNTRRTYANFLTGDYVLAPIQTGNIRLRRYGDNRLARLELTNGKSPIYFDTSMTGIAAYMPVLFCRDQSVWTIIR